MSVGSIYNISHIVTTMKAAQCQMSCFSLEGKNDKKQKQELWFSCRRGLYDRGEVQTVTEKTVLGVPGFKNLSLCLSSKNK